MRNPTVWFSNRSSTNQAVQAPKMARYWKFCIQKVEELHYPCSENKGKGTDYLRSYCEADLRLFSHMQIVGFLIMLLICLLRHFID